MPEDILNKVMSFISGDKEGGSDKQVLLKQIARDIAQNKYAKFYRVRQEEADPAFAQYFYSIYKIVYPAWVFFNDTEKEPRIRQITLESFLDKAVMDLVKRLTPDAVAERKKTAGAEISRQLEADLEALTRGFDSPRLAAADKCYNLMAVFRRFVSFDFYEVLKKFDPDISETDFSEAPKFLPLRADTIMADIAAFLSILPPFDAQDDWKTVFEIFKYCNGGVDVIPLEIWNGLSLNLKNLKQSKMLELMVRLASGNPIWEVKPAPPPDEHLSALWLEEKTAEIREVISGIADSQRNAKIAALEKVVFNGIDTTRLTYYTWERGKIYIQKELDSYDYAPALNHLTAFIQDFISKEITELCDILLVRGQWTNNSASLAMSDGYHAVLEMMGEITALDETLSEDGSNGTRLRGALLRVDRDHTQARYLNSIVSSVNAEALNIINRATQSLIIVGKHLKMLYDDYQKKPYELMMNWKELTQVSRIPMVQRLSDDYKKTNYFVQLMILETRADEQPQ
jgi:hypothetical protein